MKQTLMDAAAEARLSELEARVAALENAPKRGRKPKQEEAPVEEPVAETPEVQAEMEQVAEEVVAAEEVPTEEVPAEPVAE